MKAIKMNQMEKILSIKDNKIKWNKWKVAHVLEKESSVSPRCKPPTRDLKSSSNPTRSPNQIFFFFFRTWQILILQTLGEERIPKQAKRTRRGLPITHSRDFKTTQPWHDKISRGTSSWNRQLDPPTGTTPKAPCLWSPQGSQGSQCRAVAGMTNTSMYETGTNCYLNNKDAHIPASPVDNNPSTVD